MTIIQIAQKISNAGGRLYLVGGAVRDLLLELTVHDKDYCVTGLSPQSFETLFPQAILQGKHFPVYILNDSEFALARTEKKAGEKHIDFICDSSPSITIEEDLARRDLTINSIAIDVLTQEIIDPFHGQEDIKNNILRITSSAFCEDPLRVYRVARFASQFNFHIETTTLAMMRSMKDSLSHLSVERVFQEFRKALLTNHPSTFFQVLRDTNCLNVHFQEIADLIGVEQPLLYHPEGDAYNHTMQILEKVSTQTNDELTRFGALVHDFGKAVTPRENWPHHYNHDKLGVTVVQSFCHRLKMPILFSKAGSVSSREHMLAGIYSNLKPGTKIDFFERIYRSKSLSFEGLEIIANADTEKTPPIRFAKIGKQIMTNIHLSELDLKKLQSKKDFEKIKQVLRDKRIRALQKFESKK